MFIRKGQHMYQIVRRTFAPILVGAFVSVSGLKLSANDDDATIAVLNSAIDEWAENISFRIDYQWQRSAFSSESEALSALLGGEGISKATKEASGIIAKLAKRFRISVDYGAPPDDASRDGTRSAITNFSFDEVVCGDLSAIYYPLRGSFGNYLSVSARPEEDRGTARPRHGAFSILEAYSFGGGIDGGPLKDLRASVTPSDEWTQRIVSRDSERITVEVTLRRPPARQIIRRVVFWTKPDIPVVERIEDAESESLRGISVHTTTVADRFVKCGGGVIARRIVRTSGPIAIVGKSDKVWLGTEWIAETVNRPSDADFILRLPPKVQIRGLDNPPSTKDASTFGLCQYSLDDLVVANTPDLPAGMTLSAGNGNCIWLEKTDGYWFDGVICRHHFVVNNKTARRTKWVIGRTR